jgi:hypothetical protein
MGIRPSPPPKKGLKKTIGWPTPGSDDERVKGIVLGRPIHI